MKKIEHKSTRAQDTRIRVSNINNRYRLNVRFIRKIALDILRLLKRRPQEIQLEVIFLNDNAIRALNRRYKDRDRATDVLSFGIDLSEFGSKSRLGEIFISTETAYRNAGIFKTDFEEELTLYLIHGILHLFGYDDVAGKDRLRMSKKEKLILGSLCKNIKLSKVLTPR